MRPPPELLTCLTLEVTALGAAGHTSESGNVEIPLLELPLADGNSRQPCLHLNSEPAVQEMPCFTGYVGSRSGVLEPISDKLSGANPDTSPRTAAAVVIIAAPSPRTDRSVGSDLTIHLQSTADR